MNIFERASRAKLRFASVRGLISTEDLWDLPLTSKNGFDLNAVAKTVNGRLKMASEEDFVNLAATKKSENQVEAELQMEIVKHVIASKIAAQAAAEQREAKVAERRKLLALLESKQNQALENLSQEDILKKLAEIDAA